MRSETRGNGRKIVTSPQKKRGRPRKVRPSVIEQMKNSGDETLDIRFVRDLRTHDRTEIIEGKDSEKRYRWVDESKIALRESQGYTRSDSAKIKTHWDGNYVPPDGHEQRRVNKGGLVLMEIPEKLARMRDALKDEMVEQNLGALDSQMAGAVAESGWEALPDSDPFVQETVNRS